MGLSCKSKSAIAVCNSTSSNGTFLESFKFRDLETATNWFSRENLILRTSHGHLYRGTLPDGRVVAVKRPDASQRLHDEAFDNEVQILSKLFSRRLVNLLGCSRDGRVKLLVLEYMDNGPLHENLTELSLSWPMRVKLAVDIAKAIRALHASNPPIVHRNLRTTNVFLDRDGSARLGDFGLAKIVPEQAEPPRRSNLISIPEMGIEQEDGRHSSAGVDDFDVEETPLPESHINPKTDVYSFGILLLEVVSGRSGCDEARLLDWALPLIKHGHSMAICDPRVMPFPDSAAVRLMVSIAARCVRSSSSRRPAMEEVVQCLIKASKLIPEPLWTTTSTSSPMISTPSYPELTPSTTSSRELTSYRQTGSNSMSRRKEKLINSNLDAGHTPFNATSTSSALWSNGLNLKKKRTTLVFRLGRFLVRKLRIARRGSSYEKVPITQAAAGAAAAGTTTTKTKKKKWKVSASRRSPLKGAKVSDDLEVRTERSIVVELEEGLQHSYHKEQELSGEEDLPYHQPPQSKKSHKASNNSSRFSGHYSSGNHRSGKKFVRL